jgi:hypothetical protein
VDMDTLAARSSGTIIAIFRVPDPGKPSAPCRRTGSVRETSLRSKPRSVSMADISWTRAAGLLVKLQDDHPVNKIICIWDDLVSIWVGFGSVSQCKTPRNLPRASPGLPPSSRAYHLVHTMIYVVLQDDHPVNRISSCTHQQAWRKV